MQILASMEVLTHAASPSGVQICPGYPNLEGHPRSTLKLDLLVFSQNPLFRCCFGP